MARAYTSRNNRQIGGRYATRTQVRGESEKEFRWGTSVEEKSEDEKARRTVHGAKSRRLACADRFMPENSPASGLE